MFDDALMKTEMSSIGYVRKSKYVYRASWSSDHVEHFIFLGKDSRRYIVADFGLRNSIAEEFGIASIVKYGHPNFRVMLEHRDPSTACSMRFGFGRIDKFSGKLWPRIRIPEITGSELAAFVATFISQHVFPVTRHVTGLNSLLDFLIVDAEPHPWFAVNYAIKTAHIVAISSQLGLGRNEIRELLKPHEDAIKLVPGGKIRDPKSYVDRYVDQLLLDWKMLHN